MEIKKIKHLANGAKKKKWTKQELKYYVDKSRNT